MAISSELKVRALPDAIAHHEAAETTMGPTWHELIDDQARPHSFARARDFAVHMALMPSADRRVSNVVLELTRPFQPGTSL